SVFGNANDVVVISPLDFQNVGRVESDRHPQISIEAIAELPIIGIRVEDQLVNPVPTEEGVITILPLQSIGVGAAEESVATTPAVETILATAAVEMIVATPD